MRVVTARSFADAVRRAPGEWGCLGPGDGGTCRPCRRRKRRGAARRHRHRHPDRHGVYADCRQRRHRRVVMPNVPTGPYRLEVSLQGFRTYVQTGIVLQVGATPTINAVLGVGSLEETVSVEAATPIVDVRSAGISEVVEQERIVELPLQGRQVTDLIVLAGAAVETGRPNSRSFQGGVNISVAGGLFFGVAYLLDGAMHNDIRTSSGLPLPFPDALQEFRVATSGLTAANGMHAGASVNAVTKSGTNSFHGNAFEFLRDKRFNATSVVCRGRSGRPASAATTGCCATSTAARWAARSCATSCSSSAATRGRRRARRRPTTSPTCRPRRCWPATSPPSPRPRATAAGRSRCGRRS